MTTTSENSPQGGTPIDIAAPVPWVASDAPMPGPHASMVVDEMSPRIDSFPPERVTLEAVASEWIGTVRTHPMAALMGALVLGVVLGRVVR